jgi:hypothetical protein
MPAIMNRRIAAVRGLFEFAVMTGARAENPVAAVDWAATSPPWPAGAYRPGPVTQRRGGWCASRGGCPEALEPEDVAAFVPDLRTFRDRAITLVMLLGGAARGGGPVAWIPGGDGTPPPSARAARPWPSAPSLRFLLATAFIKISPLRPAHNKTDARA